MATGQVSSTLELITPSPLWLTWMHKLSRSKEEWEWKEKEKEKRQRLRRHFRINSLCWTWWRLLMRRAWLLFLLGSGATANVSRCCKITHVLRKFKEKEKKKKDVYDDRLLRQILQETVMYTLTKNWYFFVLNKSIVGSEVSGSTHNSYSSYRKQLNINHSSKRYM